MRKIYIFLLFITAYITVLAQWSSIRTVWFYANAYFPPTSTHVAGVDTSGNTYLVWHDHIFEFEFDIVQHKFNGTSWSGWQRVDDALSGQGYYGLSRMPSISVEPDGKRLIVWEDMKTGYFELHSKYYNNIDIPSQRQLTDDSAYTWYPKLQYADNRHHLFYIDSKSGVFNIYYNYYDSLWHNEEHVIAVDSACNDFSFYAYNDSTMVLSFLMKPYEYDNLYYSVKSNGIWNTLHPLFTGNFDVTYPNIISNSTNTFILFTANINGLYQLFMSKFNGISWSMPELISNNETNIMHPTGIINGNDFHIFFISDEFPNGIIKHSVYDIISDSIVSTETAVEVREGPIYSPKVVIDSNGNLQLMFTCADGERTSNRGPNNIYHLTLSGVKSNITETVKPYALSNYGNYYSISMTDDNDYSISILDKTGRCIADMPGDKRLILDNSYFKRNDIYFLIIKTNKNIYTEKVLWLN